MNLGVLRSSTSLSATYSILHVFETRLSQRFGALCLNYARALERRFHPVLRCRRTRSRSRTSSSASPRHPVPLFPILRFAANGCPVGSAVGSSAGRLPTAPMDMLVSCQWRPRRQERSSPCERPPDGSRPRLVGRTYLPMEGRHFT